MFRNNYALWLDTVSWNAMLVWICCNGDARFSCPINWHANCLCYWLLDMVYSMFVASFCLHWCGIIACKIVYICSCDEWECFHYYQFILPGLCVIVVIRCICIDCFALNVYCIVAWMNWCGFLLIDVYNWTVVWYCRWNATSMRSQLLQHQMKSWWNAPCNEKPVTEPFKIHHPWHMIMM